MIPLTAKASSLAVTVIPIEFAAFSAARRNGG
jgi:hypothetical protein